MVVRLHEVVQGVMVPTSTVAPYLSIAAASHSGVDARRPREQPVEVCEVAHSCPAHGAHDCFVQV